MSNKIIQLNEGVIKEELKDLVRKSVEDTLNDLLDAEAEVSVNTSAQIPSVPEGSTQAAWVRSVAIW